MSSSAGAPQALKGAQSADSGLVTSLPDSSIPLHPLFIDGLPADFRTNSVLLAIAAPFSGEREITTPAENSARKRGSGPVRSVLDAMHLRRDGALPYRKRPENRRPNVIRLCNGGDSVPTVSSATECTEADTSHRSIEELQLFFKLWKPSS